jgi:hypothetical protein
MQLLLESRQLGIFELKQTLRFGQLALQRFTFL